MFHAIVFSTEPKNHFARFLSAVQRASSEYTIPTCYRYMTRNLHDLYLLCLTASVHFCSTFFIVLFGCVLKAIPCCFGSLKSERCSFFNCSYREELSHKKRNCKSDSFRSSQEAGGTLQTCVCPALFLGWQTPTNDPEILLLDSKLNWWL